jgi:hypothetical protein
MQNLRIIAVLFVLALVAFCFVSAPVLSGEHPWDADDGSGGGETEADTTTSTVEGADGTAGQQDGSGASWWNELIAWFSQTAIGIVYESGDDSSPQTTGLGEAELQESDGRVQVN